MKTEDRKLLIEVVVGIVGGVTAAYIIWGGPLERMILWLR